MARDPRLIAEHRGGLLVVTEHRLLAQWAAACAERTVHLFEASQPGDRRPAAAVETARRWAAGGCTVGQARAAAIAAHAAARETTGPASFAARACGHAAAVAHMADHELGGAYYALRALAAAGSSLDDLDRERRWQIAAIPDAVRDVVLADIDARSAKFHGVLGPRRPPAG